VSTIADPRHPAPLINRYVDAPSEHPPSAASSPSLLLPAAAAADLNLIANGAYSPIAGFMGRADYESVVHHAQLADGAPWTLPIVLPISTEAARGLESGADIGLRDGAGSVRGVIHVAEVFERNLDAEAQEVYRTTDDDHPGVRALRAQGPLVVGGEVHAYSVVHPADALLPAQTRAEFKRRGWSTVVAFQTRNPIHRAHEYLTKVALEQVDGLLIHPLVGETKDDDIPAAVRMECYRTLIAGYYPANRVLLSTFPAAMRYAGPREAIYHGLVRRNYGCTHFIIGRDAAGVGSYYGSYDAQQLFDELGGAERLGFIALKFEHSFYCSRCDSMASERTCPHRADDRLILSGTRVREMLSEGADIPPQFTRPEVAAVLRRAYRAANTR
jgi:sulfate adenylyltransferase